MTITKRESQKVMTIMLSGSIKANHASKLDSHFNLLQIKANYFDKVKLDFSEVEMIDNTAIGKILKLYKQLKEQGRKLEIINITNKYVENKFLMLNLDQIMAII